ncbi:hypothetical protein ROHU_028536 [Labeo rohita]|uniref:Uncharacterized protein n=1 Tax=Labeo rohita TaxID=84645 RepID=A0A498M5K4_LABRO|nr:hypothetical protein ROHU_028536 [Labeo rohita]
MVKKEIILFKDSSGPPHYRFTKDPADHCQFEGGLSFTCYIALSHLILICRGLRTFYRKVLMATENSTGSRKQTIRTDMLTVHAIGWNQRKENGLHIALSSRFKKTVEKTLEVTGSLKKMQDQLHCCDDMLKQWVVDVKQWASSGKTSESSDTVYYKLTLVTHQAAGSSYVTFAQIESPMAEVDTFNHRTLTSLG